MKKSIDTLIEDIHAVFTDPSHSVSDNNLQKMGDDIQEVVKTAIQEAHNYKDKQKLRMSKIGTPDRKLWFELNHGKGSEDTGDLDDIEDIPVDPNLAMKFLYGHILEQVLIFFIRESGHLVEGEQDELDIDGIKGHRDLKIDGTNVDIKTASKFSFSKFANGKLFEDDPFGYIAQISGYVQADQDANDDDGAAFLVLNKESGEITLMKVDSMDMIDAEQRVKEVKEIADRETPPSEKCYSPQPQGKGGNYVLHKYCEFCPFKEMCWAGDGGLRKFQYSNGTKYFTHVESMPNVPEITD